MLCGLAGQVGVGPTELGKAACGLLEVVANDLLEFDERAAVGFEPGGKAAVQVGADALRQAVVDRVANQQMPEAVAVLVRELGPIWADELLADERHQPLGLRLAVAERFDSAAV